MKFSIHFAWRLGLIATLVGCGGGGGGTPPATTTVSGVALNSYLENAIVFLDLNGDGVLNNGEPSATTNANGEFSFPTTESLNGRFLVVKATTATKMDGALLSQGMTLMTPAEKPSVISPLTTEVVAKMKNDGASFDAAKSAVQSELGLDASLDVMKDYIKEKSNNSAYAKVQNVSTVVSALLKTVEAQSTSSTPVATRLAALNTEINTKLLPIVLDVKNAADVLAAKKRLDEKIDELGKTVGGFQNAWALYTINTMQQGKKATLLGLNNIKDSITDVPGIVNDPAIFRSIVADKTTLRMGTTFQGRYHDLQIQFKTPIDQPNLIIQSISRKTGGSENLNDGVVETSVINTAPNPFPGIATGSGILFSGQSNNKNGQKCADTTVRYEFSNVSNVMTFKLIVNETDFQSGTADCVAANKRPVTETFSFNVNGNYITLNSIETAGSFSSLGIPFKGVLLESFTPPQ